MVVDESSTIDAKYINTLLEDHVLPFAQFIGSTFIFMDNNALLHHAQIVKEYLRGVGIVHINSCQVPTAIH